MVELNPISITHGNLGKSRVVRILECLRKYTRATYYRNDLLHRKQQAQLMDIQTELNAMIKKQFLTRVLTLLRTDEYLLD